MLFLLLTQEKNDITYCRAVAALGLIGAFFGVFFGASSALVFFFFRLFSFS
jgi:hypothetical protein